MGPPTPRPRKKVRLQWNLMKFVKNRSKYTVPGRFLGSRGRRRPFQAETGEKNSISPPGSGPMYAIVYPDVLAQLPYPRGPPAPGLPGRGLIPGVPLAAGRVPHSTTGGGPDWREAGFEIRGGSTHRRELAGHPGGGGSTQNWRRRGPQIFGDRRGGCGTTPRLAVAAPAAGIPDPPRRQWGIQGGCPGNPPPKPSPTLPQTLHVHPNRWAAAGRPLI